MARSTNPFVRQAKGIFLLVMAALGGGISGVMFAYSPDLPEVSTLDDYAPSTITRVYANGGQEIGQFATERRVIIGYGDIPDVLRNAIISSEDASFFSHFGLNLRRTAITLVHNVLRWRRRGASTLTQQLARKVSLDGAAPLGTEKLWSRKINEALVTLQIEKRYTKSEIFTLYCNQMYLGSGAYGVEAAAHLLDQCGRLMLVAGRRAQERDRLEYPFDAVGFVGEEHGHAEATELLDLLVLPRREDHEIGLDSEQPLGVRVRVGDALQPRRLRGKVGELIGRDHLLASADGEERLGGAGRVGDDARRAAVEDEFVPVGAGDRDGEGGRRVGGRPGGRVGRRGGRVIATCGERERDEQQRHGGRTEHGAVRKHLAQSLLQTQGDRNAP